MKDNNIRLAFPVRVIDGDTFIARVVLGFDADRNPVAIRLYGYDAIELRDPGGLEAKNRFSSLIQFGVDILPRGRSFARWVCEMWVNDVPVSELMGASLLRAWTDDRRREVMRGV